MDNTPDTQAKNQQLYISRGGNFSMLFSPLFSYFLRAFCELDDAKSKEAAVEDPRPETKAPFSC